MALDQDLKPGYVFWCTADGRRCAYEVVERVKLCPWQAGKGYAMEPSASGTTWRLKGAKLRGAVHRQDLSQRIGMHGGVWHVTTR